MDQPANKTADPLTKSIKVLLELCIIAAIMSFCYKICVKHKYGLRRAN